MHPLKGTANQPRVMQAALASGATTLDGTPKATAVHCHEENMLKYVSVVARTGELRRACILILEKEEVCLLYTSDAADE